MLNALTGLPWQLGVDAGGNAIDDIISVPQIHADPVLPRAELPIAPDGAPGAPRRFYIRRNVELLKYGPTPGCKGCEAAFDGNRVGPAVVHDEHCRRRIEECMRNAGDAVRVEEAESRASGPSTTEATAAPQAMQQEEEPLQDAPRPCADVRVPPEPRVPAVVRP